MGKYEQDAHPMPAPGHPAAYLMPLLQLWTSVAVAVAVDSSFAALVVAVSARHYGDCNCAKVLAGKMQVLFSFLHARSAPSLPVYQYSASCLSSTDIRTE